MPKYYMIDEAAAKRANDVNSFRDYIPGSATEAYHSEVDEAYALAAEQKSRVDPMYHDKIDSLVDSFSRKRAANLNERYSIESRVPSVMISGAANFPVKKKEKQNAARDRNDEEARKIQGILDKIRSTGMGGISADDPEAIQKLERKLADLIQHQEFMKAVNAYYRKNKTLKGCPCISPETASKITSSIKNSGRTEPKPFETYRLSNNNAEIRRLKERIETLKKQKETTFEGWKFEGGEVVLNKELNRLQIIFEDKPDEELRGELKSHGFRWAPSQQAWQRQFTNNALYAIKRIKAVQPKGDGSGNE